MRSMNRCLPAALIALFLAVMISCAGCGPTASRPACPAAHFDETQANTVFPHGRYVPGSAQEVDNGYIQYETDDGSNWRTRYTPTGNGYGYGNVERVQ